MPSGRLTRNENQPQERQAKAAPLSGRVTVGVAGWVMFRAAAVRQGRLAKAGSAASPVALQAESLVESLRPPPPRRTVWIGSVVLREELHFVERRRRRSSADLSRDPI